MSDNLPVVDAARVASVYEELKGMQIKLDSNPIEFGPRRMNAHIAKVRSQLDRVEQIFLQVSQDLHVYKRELNESTALYELEKNHLLFNDMEVRSERSQKEREGKADTKLRDTLKKIRVLESRVYDLEQLMVVVKAKRTDLKDKQGRMRDQMKLIDHDLSMGARWGTKAAPSYVGSVSDIDTMLSNLDSDSGFTDFEEDEALDPPQGSNKEVSEPLVEVTVETSTKEPVSPPVEDMAFDLDSFIPSEGVKGSQPESEASQEDADSFLSNLESTQKKSSIPQDVGIEGLIDALVD